MASAVPITFLIATYQRGAILLDCLRQVSQCGLAADAFEIIVVDNASPDGTADLIARELPRVKLIRLARNEGPVAKNHGLKVARGEFVVFLDDDAYPLPGAMPQLLRHFAADPLLGAAVFDVTLSDQTRESSAYPDVFIGAGTGFRKSVLDQVGGLPAEFFMQAEEYDLSFRILQAGYSIQRFDDLPLRHLKAPHSRIAERTTQMDVRNNLYLLAKYIPAPLCFEFAADWLSRYWMMAYGRDHAARGCGHRAAFMRGVAEGLKRWSKQRSNETRLLDEATLEKIFKFSQIQGRLESARKAHGFSRILLADFGKNMLAYYRAIQRLGIQPVAIADDRLAASDREYRGIPIVTWVQAQQYSYDAILISNLSPVQAQARAQQLRQTHSLPILHLFE